MAASRDEPAKAGDTVRLPSQPAGRPLNVGRLWAGGAATAVVAALVALVGVLVVRTVLRVAESGGASDPLGGQTAVLCLLSALGALAATGLAHLLLTTTPRPLTYLSWIVGLATAVAVVLPLVTGESIVRAGAQALIHLAVGMTIGSLVVTAARASRPYLPVRPTR